MGRPAKRVSGPLASLDSRYRSWLLAQGFTPGTVSDVIFHLDGLSRWLEREQLAVSELTPERVGEFESGAGGGGVLQALGAMRAVADAVSARDRRRAGDPGARAGGRAGRAGAGRLPGVSGARARAGCEHDRQLRAGRAVVPGRLSGGPRIGAGGVDRGGCERLPRARVPEAHRLWRQELGVHAAAAAALSACQRPDRGAAALVGAGGGRSARSVAAAWG